MLELWGMRSTPLLPLLPALLWVGVVEPDRALIYRLDRTKMHTHAKLNCLKLNCFLHLTVCKQKLYLY